METAYPGSVVLRIGNETNKETARNVEVLLIDVEAHPFAAVRQPPKHASTVSKINQSLVWPDGSTRIDIHPGLRREMDIGDVDGWLGSSEEPPTLRLHISRLAEEPGNEGWALTVPENDDRYMFPVAYFTDEMRNAPVRLRLVVIADNVNAAHYTLEAWYPWDKSWTAFAGLGAVEVRLVNGHVARSPDPHMLAGGPWGELAGKHDPEEWRRRDIPPAADAYTLVVTDADGEDHHIWRSPDFGQEDRDEADRRLAEYEFREGEQAIRAMVLLDGNRMELSPEERLTSRGKRPRAEVQDPTRLLRMC